MSLVGLIEHNASINGNDKFLHVFTKTAETIELVKSINLSAALSEDGLGSLKLQDQEIRNQITELDAVVATFSPQTLRYINLTLPFNNPRALEQILPGQLQERLPFDPDDFVINFSVSPSSSDNLYDIVVALADKNLIANVLNGLEVFGIDPKVLTTRGACVATLGQFTEATSEETYCIFQSTFDHTALVLIQAGKIKAIREIAHSASASGHNDEALLRETISQIIKFQKDFAVPQFKIYSTEANKLNEAIAKLTRLEVISLDLRSHFQSNLSAEDFENLTWATGILHDLLERKKESDVLNYRIGPFQYRATLANIISSAKEEWFGFSLFSLIGLLCIVAVIAVKPLALLGIESKITTALNSGLPNELLPKRREVNELETKIQNLETELQNLGSLSSISPLESLKELAQSLTPELEVSIEKLSIGSEGMSISGTAASRLAVGRLSTILEEKTDLFTSVRIESGDKVQGSNRMHFSAELVFKT
ncbi:hypothetical protein JNK13_10605 [bacterium]|nr:hypothetical protein [bacterium]